MKTRIITALVCIPLLVAILLSEKYVVTVAIIAVALVGLNEFYRATRLSEKHALCAIGYIAAIVIPLTPCIIQQTHSVPVMLHRTLFYLFMLAIFICMLADHKNVSAADAGMLILSVIYIPYFLTDIINIRMLEHGRFYIWLVFIGAFLTDSCAYFSGIFLGRHKLCPEISPKKTVEGAIGGVLGCALFYMIYGLIMRSFGLDISFARLALLGIIAAVISETGDLAASIIKRRYGIKDYGTLFPGHGGILDRCDSVILVAPAIYLFLTSVGI